MSEGALSPAPRSQSAPSIRTRIKTLDSCLVEAVDYVRVPHPLEQGLRQKNITLSVSAQRCQSAPSIRTRIKTIIFFYIVIIINCQSAPSIRTRIKTHMHG